MGESAKEIMEFVSIIEKDENMQLLVKAAKSPAEIIRIAESVGIKMSMNQLRYWSRELTARYFPWANRGNQWRREYFEEERLD